MAMSKVLKVDVGIVTNKLNSFKDKLKNLQNYMQAIKVIIETLSKVSWISPSARAFLAQFQMLYKQIEEAIRIVQEYIHDLEIVIQQYTAIEQRLQDKAGSLRTDIFGV